MLAKGLPHITWELLSTKPSYLADRIGIRPEGMSRNRTFAEAGVDAGETELCKQDLLYDPQTAGGLLMAVDPADADALLEELEGCVPSARRIGLVRDYQGGKRIFLR